MRRWIWTLRVVAGLSLIALEARGGVDVLTYHNDNGRTGQNLAETILAPTNISDEIFGKLFTYVLDGDVYTQPLYVSKLAMRGGTHDVVFVATEHNSVYALDADTNAGPGGVLWHVNLGPSVTTPNPDFGNRYGGFKEISTEVGITGTPVIDLANETLYVDAFTHEGAAYIHRIHALNITTGAERALSPQIVSVSVPGRGAGSTNGVLTFQAIQHLQRSALTLASGVLYVPYTGYADSDPYHGWIIGFNPTTLQPSPGHVFVTTPNSTIEDFGTNAGEAGIWMGGCGLGVDAAGDLYLATGNGAFNAYNGAGGTEYGDTFLKLSPARGMPVLDYFTPYNPDFLWTNDLDVGSGGVVLLPNQPGPVPHLMIGGGKPGSLYVINRDQFTATNNHCNYGATSDAVLQTIQLNGGIFATPTYFNGNVYITAANDVTGAFPVENGRLAASPSSVGSRTYPFPGATASISANGSLNGILWLVVRANPAILVADDANDVSQELYNSDEAGARDQLPEGTKFSAPTVADGKVFVAGQSALTVFGMLPVVNQPSVGVYSGLFYGSNGAQIGQSGYVSVTVGAKARYIARLQWASGLYSFSGQFDSTGAASSTFKVPNQNPLQIQMEYVTNGPPCLTGTIGNGTWQANVNAYEAVFNARTHVAPFAGSYALLLQGPNDGDPQKPQGSGWGTAVVNTAGAVTFHGTLADGTPVSQTSTISANGQWPFYGTLYAGRGQVLGWLGFDSNSVSGVSGSVQWTKLPVTGAKSYAAGFSFSTGAAGSNLSGVPAKSRVLNFASGVLVLSGSSLALTNFVTVSASGEVLNTNHWSISFSPASCLFKGTAPNPSRGAPLSFSGVFLQNENYGGGYFLDSGQSGAVYLGPRPD